jgi:hypothetical protein
VNVPGVIEVNPEGGKTARMYAAAQTFNEPSKDEEMEVRYDSEQVSAPL